MKQLVIDAQYGMSGDMLSAALIDLGAPRGEVLGAMSEAAHAIGGANIEIAEIKRGDTKGMLLSISLSGSEPDIDASELYSHLEDFLVRRKVHDLYFDFALRAFDILSHAEFEAHNAASHHHDHMNHEDELHGVHLHEAKDIVIDLVGAAVGMQELGIDVENVICLVPVMVGGGKVKFSHGEVAVPAPATASIIESYDIPIKPGPVERELFTPTGASILASLNPHFEDRKSFSLTGKRGLSTGTGFGTIDLFEKHKLPNALFIHSFDAS